jgi:hypothetical protein
MTINMLPDTPFTSTNAEASLHTLRFHPPDCAFYIFRVCSLYMKEVGFLFFCL